MHSLAHHEQKQHGTQDFPVAYYFVDVRHPRNQMPFHWHNEWELLRILDGSFQLRLDDDEYVAKAGDVLLIRGGMLHGGTPRDCNYECLDFDLHALFRGMDMVKKYLRPFYQQTLLPYNFFPRNVQPEICAAADRLMEAFAEGEESCPELETVGCLSSIFAHIHRNGLYIHAPEGAANETVHIRQIKSVLEFIESHYGEPVSLESLAQVAGMNPKYFCRMFRSITSHSPIDYVNYYRIERAAYLLVATDLPITNVGLDCGFLESSYFTKVFRRYKNLSPREYRTVNSR